MEINMQFYMKGIFLLRLFETEFFYSTTSWALLHVNKYRIPARLSVIWPCLPLQAHLKLLPLLLILFQLVSLLFLKHTKPLPTWGPFYFLFPCSWHTLPPVLSLTDCLIFVTHVWVLMSPLRGLQQRLSVGATQSLCISSHRVIFIIIVSLKLTD